MHDQLAAICSKTSHTSHIAPELKYLIIIIITTIIIIIFDLPYIVTLGKKSDALTHNVVSDMIKAYHPPLVMSAVVTIKILDGRRVVDFC